MTTTAQSWLRAALLAAVIVLPALALGSCGSGRDRELSERLMAAQMAAEKAEQASLTAQKAAAQIASNSGGAAVVADDAALEEEDEEAKSAEDPDSGVFDNEIVSRPVPEAPPAPTGPVAAPPA